MQKVYEGVEFCPDMDSVNPNLMGTARQVVEIVPEPVQVRSQHRLTPQEAQRVLDVACLHPDAVSSHLVEQARQVMGIPAVATTVDVATYEA